MVQENMVEIIPISRVGEDERGTTHYFDTDRTGQFIISYRNAGSASGRHYHKGRSVNKNPEKIILMHGQATLNWFNVKGTEKGSEPIKAPAMVLVYPWIWHEVIADTDIVIFELNALEDGKEDTFRI